MIQNIHLFFQQSDISCRYAVPGRCHGSHIIKHVTFRFFYRTKIRHYFFRFHYNLTKKQYTRTYNFCNHTHHTDDCVYLFEISAGSSYFFPDIWHRINSYDIYSLICQIQEIIHHLIKHSRIAVIQIPLIRIKCCHYIMAVLRKIRKVSRSCCRKYLRYCLLVFLRYLIIIIEEIPAHILSFASSCPLRPFMVF